MEIFFPKLYKPIKSCLPLSDSWISSQGDFIPYIYTPKCNSCNIKTTCLISYWFFNTTCPVRSWRRDLRLTLLSFPSLDSGFNVVPDQCSALLKVIGMKILFSLFLNVHTGMLICKKINENML